MKRKRGMKMGEAKKRTRCRTGDKSIKKIYSFYNGLKGG